MNTEKLYYAKPDLFEFGATVLDCRPEGGGFAVVLDRTCFFPGGGGQPEDRGSLNGIAVSGMRESAGEILHLVPSPLPKGPVHGSVDPGRRLDYREQHTGQHILSRALLETAELETVSVHFGEETATIELKADAVPEETLNAAEEAANRVIKENRPVKVHEVTPEEAARFPVRRALPDEKTIRIVEVEGFDWVACSGVHAASSGEVFMVKILSTEKIRGRVRLYAVMGRRAFEDYARKTAAMQRLSRFLTCSEAEVPAAVEKISADARAQARELRRLCAEAAKAAARAAVAQARRVGPALFASAVMEGLGAEAPAAFAEEALSQPGRFAAGAAVGPEGFHWIAAHSLENGPDLRALLTPVIAEFGGKGGGKGGRMQGSAGDASRAAEFLKRIEEALAADRPG